MKFTVVNPILDNGCMNIELMNYLVNKHEFKGCPIFRFYTVSMLGIPLYNLSPLPYVMETLRNSNTELGDGDSKNFDMEYAHQLMNHAPSFVDLCILVDSFQRCEETFLLSEFSKNSVVNSLIKFIYERYSVNAFLVRDLIDIDELQVSNFDSEEGYSNLINDLDKYRMTYFTEKQINEDCIDYDMIMKGGV